ncbi:MAG TPA: gamma-glutamyltransferase [Geminicoccaceae bacterium]|nr:gamma-glutamyltransferase [Geminicoccaceae bacterium]
MPSADRDRAGRRLRLLALALLLLLLPLPPAAGQGVQPEGATGRQEKRAVTAERFMVVAANPLAARAGYDVLAEGGSAADAAVAVQTVLNLVEPQSSGIGGGAFMLHWDAAAGELGTLDGRETAPMAATPELFLKPDGTPMSFQEALVGGRSVGTPGVLRLLEVAHGMHGRLPWARLFRPAIDLAERGFEVSPRLARLIAEAADLDRYEATRAYFFNDDGTPLRAGQRLRNPEFAATLRLIAAEGADALYRGEIADDIVAAVRGTGDNPGLLAREDLEGYAVKLRDPVCIVYRAHEVCGMGPPSSGGLTVGQILGLLDHFDLRGMGLGADAVHLFAEASRLAYADRGLYMADADFVRMPTAGLLDPTYLTVRAQLIDRDRAMGKAAPGNPPWRDAALWAPDGSHESAGTSHFSIVDADGNALSMTTSIETGFGSRVMVRGFLLNNQLTDFSFVPEEDGRPVANRVEPGKRPRSSMAPTIVLGERGEPHLLIGSPGGSRIIGYVAKTIVAVLDWGMDIQGAIALGHFESRNDTTDLEAGTDVMRFLPDLEARGHEVNAGERNSGLHGIVIEAGRLTGGADPRREGVALGE